ncbi:hypothetical protein Fcan01_26767 [Folsomia candida]|uniref:Uncharacterized protein n=1 Tax=Folsomia candida TaxID=158441 RepID=A0A226CZ19_FOLCA|nr:hypothetical protein Fcan01_26767 [Folsomia candida]
MAWTGRGCTSFCTRRHHRHHHHTTICPSTSTHPLATDQKHSLFIPTLEKVERTVCSHQGPHLHLRRHWREPDQKIEESQQPHPHYGEAETFINQFTFSLFPYLIAQERRKYSVGTATLPERGHVSHDKVVLGRPDVKNTEEQGTRLRDSTSPPPSSSSHHPPKVTIRK